MKARDEWKRVQAVLGTSTDGIPGPNDQNALVKLQSAAKANLEWPDKSGWIFGKASSFADPADVSAFRRCKAHGKSDKECFKVGDNGVGCWGDDTSQGSGASCAVPPDEMIEKWGSVSAAKHKPIIVSANGKEETVILKDRMPERVNITNGAVIDLNPDAAHELGLIPPFMVSAKWRWA